MTRSSLALPFAFGAAMLASGCATLEASPTYDFASHSCALLTDELKVAEVNLERTAATESGTSYQGAAVPDNGSIATPASLGPAGMGGPYEAGTMKRRHEAQLAALQARQDAESAYAQVMEAMATKDCISAI